MKRRRRNWQSIPEPKDPDPAYPAHLRGLSHTQLGKPRGLKGSTFGAASPGRKLTAEERQTIEGQKRKDGKL